MNIIAMLENDDSAVAVGKRLKRLRLMAGLTRDGLAKEANVGKTSISYWEHAKPDSNPMKERNVAKIIGAIRRAGVECSERWLLTGLGSAPRIMGVQNPSINLEDSEKNNAAMTLSIFDKELQLFISSSPLAVTTQVENNCMLPAVAYGDIVGGIWQPATHLKSEKICIVLVNGQLQVRRVKEGSAENLYNLSYLLYDPSESTPFEIKDFPLEKIAPLIRTWRC